MEDERKESMDSRKSVNFTLNASTTISVDRFFSQSLCMEDERKESMDSRKSVNFTLNASTTFSGVSGGLFRKSPLDRKSPPDCKSPPDMEGLIDFLSGFLHEAV